MIIKGTNYSISKNQEGDYYYDMGFGWTKASDEVQEYVKDLYNLARQRSASPSDPDRLNRINSLRSQIVNAEPVSNSSVNLEMLAQRIMNFFSEFHFEPNFRFINTFAYKCKESGEAPKEYITNYFELTDNPYASSVTEKMNSQEFKDIIKDTYTGTSSKSRINQRFKLYYGSQGTGKTTEAMKEAEACMVCHSAMLPSDLMEDFKFVDGKADFQPSALQNAMVNGTKILLDEINLLPFESLRFLQSILDGKTEFTYKGKTIKIAEGFQVIGTMNLVVNGCTYALPEPLVGRAEDLKKFVLTAKNLMCAFD